MSTLTAPADTALCADCGTTVTDPEATPGGCDTGPLCETDLETHMRGCCACTLALIDAMDAR